MGFLPVILMGAYHSRVGKGTSPLTRMDNKDNNKRKRADERDSPPATRIPVIRPDFFKQGMANNTTDQNQDDQEWKPILRVWEDDAKSHDGGDYEYGFIPESGDSNNERVGNTRELDGCGRADGYTAGDLLWTKIYLHCTGSVVFREGCEISALWGVPG
jgi:hypothetical protein